MRRWTNITRLQAKTYLPLAFTHTPQCSNRVVAVEAVVAEAGEAVAGTPSAAA